MAGEIGALRVTLGANTAQFEQGMRRAASTARRTGQDMVRSANDAERAYVRLSERGVRAFSTMRVGLIGIASALAGNFLFQQARGALEWASGLGETAQQIGVTVEQLQILRLAADQNGASVEGMERAVAILNRTLGQARAGLPAAVQAFRAIGISREQLQTFRSAGDAFPVVAQAISRLGTASEQAAGAQRLFGRGAAELLPILSQGKRGWDEATQAAIRNGMVTDEQARKADEVADSFAAIATALRVDLVNAIGDALPGLLELGRILGWLAGLLIRVLGFLGRVAGFLLRPHSLNLMDGVMAAGQQRAGQGALAAGAGALWWNQGRAGGDVPSTLDLSPPHRGGGGRHANDNAARNAHEFDTEQRRLQMDTLRAQLEQTQALDERNEIQGRLADLENEQWRADLAYRQSQGEINEAQARILTEKHDQVVLAETISRAQEYNLRVAQQENEIADKQQGYAENRVRYESEMAETMADRRRLELDLLRITMENRRRALAAQIAMANANNDPHAAAMAQLELDNLPAEQRREEGRINRNTRGPLESYLAGLPLTAAKLNEALQNVASEGLASIVDGLTAVITGTESMGKAFKRIANQIIADLVRIALQRAIVGALGNALGGLFGGGGGFSFATKGLGSATPGPFGIPIAGARAAGGPVLPGRSYLVGEKGPELLHMGGMGGNIVAKDQIGAGGSIVVHQSFKFDGVAVTKDEFMQGLMATKFATQEAIRQANRRRA